MFKFKTFEIEQGRSAMKVCTDACIFGAFIDPDIHQQMLDIGTGTGLLSLMVAQRSSCHITAVEIDSGACLDAGKNFRQSIYRDRINLVNDSIQNYAVSKSHFFDLIVSNPPFYQNNLKSPLPKKNAAHHDETLNFDELVSSIDKLMTQNGSLWILLPPAEMDIFSDKAQNASLYLRSKLSIKHHALKKVFREVALFKRTPAGLPVFDELNIFEKDNVTYTSRFRTLLKDYYTIF